MIDYSFRQSLLKKASLLRKEAWGFTPADLQQLEEKQRRMQNVRYDYTNDPVTEQMNQDHINKMQQIDVNKTQGLDQANVGVYNNLMNGEGVNGMSFNIKDHPEYANLANLEQQILAAQQPTEEERKAYESSQDLWSNLGDLFTPGEDANERLLRLQNERQKKVDKLTQQAKTMRNKMQVDLGNGTTVVNQVKQLMREGKMGEAQALIDKNEKLFSGNKYAQGQLNELNGLYQKDQDKYMSDELGKLGIKVDPYNMSRVQSQLILKYNNLLKTQGPEAANKWRDQVELEMKKTDNKYGGAQMSVDLNSQLDNLYRKHMANNGAQQPQQPQTNTQQPAQQQQNQQQTNVQPNQQPTQPTNQQPIQQNNQQPANNNQQPQQQNNVQQVNNVPSQTNQQPANNNNNNTAQPANNSSQQLPSINQQPQQQQTNTQQPTQQQTQQPVQQQTQQQPVNNVYGRQRRQSNRSAALQARREQRRQQQATWQAQRNEQRGTTTSGARFNGSHQATTPGVQQQPATNTAAPANGYNSKPAGTQAPATGKPVTPTAPAKPATPVKPVANGYAGNVTSGTIKRQLA